MCIKIIIFPEVLVFVRVKGFLVFMLSSLLFLIVSFVGTKGALGIGAGVEVKKEDSLSQNIFCPDEILASYDYIFIGEDHRDSAPYFFLEGHRGLFEQLAFKNIMVEYIEDRGTPLKREEVLDLSDFYPDWGYATEKYYKITDLFLKSPFTLFGLDRRSDLSYMHPRHLQKLTIRDRRMFEIAARQVAESSGQKFIFFNGSDHSYIRGQGLGQSFYELFKEEHKDAKTLNLKIDYLAPEGVSLQRLKLLKYKNIYDVGCPGGFFFFKDPEADSFDFYIFRDKSDLNPKLDSLGIRI